uniref:PKD-like domain-containing protein n=1 Tax=Flavobacterium sp. TaxID=239 RepID=UPI00404765CC
IASQELCQNVTPAILEVTTSGGVGSTYLYQWYSNTTNSNSGGTQILGEINATYTPPTASVGTMYYYVEVSQPASGCSAVSTTAEVIVNASPAISSQPVSSIICEGGTATQLTVNYENGVDTPTYQWYENSTDSTTNGTEIPGATSDSYVPPTDTVGTIYYYVVIEFPSGGCSDLVSNIVSIEVSPVPYISSGSSTICSGNSFAYDPSLISGNLVPAGTLYTWSSPTITPLGSVTGASEQLTPQSSINQTLQNNIDVPATVIYTVTPQSGVCLGASFDIVVTVNPAITANVIVKNNACFGSDNASLEATISGGIPFSSGVPYQITWSGPNGFSATDSNIYNLEPGIYTLDVNDAGGCPFSKEYIISEPEELVIILDEVKNINCYGYLDGIIQITVNGGTAPFKYNWTTTDGSGIVQGSEDQTALGVGTYNVVVTDVNGCVISETVTLTEPSPLATTVISSTAILCFGEPTGAIEIAVQGGTPFEISPGVYDYQYHWVGPNGFTSNSQNISNLIAGTYLVTVTDSLGCTQETSITLTQPTEIIIDVTKTDVTCYGANDGSIQIAITGGNAPYTISWSNLGNGLFQNNLSAGIYTVTVEDQNGCQKIETIEITQPIFYIDPVVKQITCFGENDGSIDLNIVGGVSPLNIKWDDDSSAGIQRNNLSAGTYTVLLTDSDTYQCPIKASFTIIEPLQLSLNGIVEDAIDCTIVNSGSVDLQVVGGTLPYRYRWSNGATTEDLTNIPPGNYLVTVTDAHACTETKQFNVIRQEPLAISLTENVKTACELKEVMQETIAMGSGGFPPYTFSWSGGVISGSNNEIMTTDQSGAYRVEITDSQGCSYKENFNVNIPYIGNQSFDYTSFGIENYQTLSIDDPIQFTNKSTGDYISIRWDFGDGSLIVYEENPTHTYTYEDSFVVTQTVEYAVGCTYSYSRTLTVTKGYELINPTGFTPNNDGINDVIRPKYKGLITIEMSIYDTWGSLIYSEEGLELNGWDGLLKGVDAENGNYIMVVKGTSFYGRKINETTPITLLK